MTTNVRSTRWSQIVAWAVASLFVLGFFLPFIGALTGPMAGVWFVSTQKPRRGFLWMMAFSFLPSLIAAWRKFPLTGSPQALEYLGWMLLTTLLDILPFTFHRLASPRLPGFLSTLPLPLATVAISSPTAEAGLKAFIIGWFAATLLWMWNHESRATAIFLGAGIGMATCFKFLHYFDGTTLPWPAGAILGWTCLGGVLIIGIWVLFHPIKQKIWATRPETVALLQSPFTGNPVHVIGERGGEVLVSSSGERFPVRDGIPAFLKPEDLTGDNGKYNHLYETIGGFYDDIQRIFCALKGFDRDRYFRSYMDLLEVRAGESVLETSVGTGLNFKYLPHGVKLSGLDLSPEMLAHCQANLRRLEMDADLFLGNAETLPFNDGSFDVVFHVGGINFFNDRAKAIREMIRVARPGSLLLIADETEKHVKEVYEKGLGGYFKNRKEPVRAPVDLVPPAMEEVHLESLRNGMFYALTFRKPEAINSADSVLQ